ncbi:MAG: hypothetical protein ACFFDT_34820 [Candidatus Hodarchaeota archaeon]
MQNTGKATGYGQLVTKSIPSGISLDFIGPDMVTGVESGSNSQKTVSMKVDPSVTPGSYEATIELRNSTSILDTLNMNITVISTPDTTPSQEPTPYGSFIITLLTFGIIIIIFDRNRK